MAFKNIRLYNFRNIKDATINIDSSTVFFIGNNGQGKTNLIEAIYYICYGSSFRLNNDAAVIKDSYDSCFIHGKYNDEKDFEKDVDVCIYKKKKKVIKVNSKEIKDRKLLIENIPCIIFSYNDMNYVNGSPDIKRWFFNQTLCLFDLLFIDLLRDYNKILKNRNWLLKNGNSNLMDVYNEKLIEIGLEIQNKRKVLIKEFNEILTPLYSDITDDDDILKIQYKSSWERFDSADKIINYLNDNLNRDLLYKTTTTGPHRDNFSYMINHKNFNNFGSTGQTRIVSLILRITQALFFLKKTGKKPVLLLDDVLLETDSSKRKKIIKNLPAYEQAFFTFLPNENYFDYIKDNILIYNIENGIVSNA